MQKKPTNETIDDAVECEHDFVVHSHNNLIVEDDGCYQMGICTDCKHPVKHRFSSYEFTQWVYSGEENKQLRGQPVMGRVGRDKNAKYKDEGFAQAAIEVEIDLDDDVL